MNHSTRQRVVGSIVLILAAVIILPAVLDGDGVRSTDLETRMPEAPPEPDALQVNPRRPVITADTPAIRVQPSGDDTRPDTDDSQTGVADSPAADASSPSGVETDSAPGLDERGLPEAWSVQLGAFSNQNNVSSLLERLREAGHAAYTQPISSPSGELTGVYVGPLVDRDAALALQAQLRENFALAGRVVRYRIEER